MIVGSIYKSRNYGEMEVVEYYNSLKVKVRFLSTGYETITRKSHIQTGSVKDMMFPNVFERGYLGEGKHKAFANGKDTKVYKTWQGMFQRCYSEAYLSKKPSYRGCSVDPRWYNFQVFGDWFDEHFPKDGGNYQLDKDLIITGNKVYSPEACVFVSPALNAFLTDCARARGGERVRGCHTKQGSYATMCMNPFTGEQEYLGTYETEEESHQTWRKKKHEHSKTYAEMLEKSGGDQRLINAMKVRFA